MNEPGQGSGGVGGARFSVGGVWCSTQGVWCRIQDEGVEFRVVGCGYIRCRGDMTALGPLGVYTCLIRVSCEGVG